jgi:hypothetical protein
MASTMLRSRPPPPRRIEKPDDVIKTSVARLVDNVVVVVHTSLPPSNEEWNSYMQTVVAAGRAHSGDLMRCRQLVMTDGGGPNSAQRAAAQKTAAQVNGEAMPVAVVSSSTLVRGIVTAFNWFNMNMKVFSPVDVRAAFDFLRVKESTVQAIWAALDSIQDELGIVETIQVARDAFKP